MPNRFVLLMPYQKLAMRTVLIIILWSASNLCFGQWTSKFPSKSNQVNLNELSKEDQRYFEIQNLEAPMPGGNSEKEQLLKLKQELSLKYPRKQTSENKTRKSAATDPIIQNGYEGNAPGGSVPCDNTLAISNSGIVMTARNSTYMIYDTNGDSVMVSGPLRDFIPGIPGALNDYDPKVIYDPMEDRFILLFLLGNSPPSTYIVACFPETSDPTGNWNMYYLDGDPFSTGHWSDYPAMSLSEEELFITINLLVPGGSWQTSFHQTIIWQIDKMNGYNGDAALSTIIWDDIDEGGLMIRNMHPVRGGIYPKGPNQYFLSNRNFAAQSDSIYLIEITNTIASGAATRNTTLLHSGNDYFLSPSARQSITDSLQTNDSRVLGAIWENDEIHFVQNCMDTSSGNSAIYHGVISNVSTGSYVCSGSYISDPVRDFGYPNIAHIGEISTDDKYIIAFEYVSPVDSAGTACVQYDGIDYSNINIIKKGEGVLNRLSGTQERWGDYTGIHKKYNQPCAVWCCGTFARNDDGYGAWISELRTQSADCASNVNIDEESLITQELKLYPNPSIDLVEIKFSMPKNHNAQINILDMSGRIIEQLYNGLLKKGENLLSFSVYHLSSGQYQLIISTDNKSISTSSFFKD